MTPNDALKFRTFSQVKVVVIVFSLGVVLGLLIWSLYNYQPTRNFYGPHAIYSIILLSVPLALLGRILLLRMLKLEAAATSTLYHHLPSSWQALFLFDITAPLYLAAGVLLGVPAAALTALVTQTVLQAFSYVQHFVTLVEPVIVSQARRFWSSLLTAHLPGLSALNKILPGCPNLILFQEEDDMLELTASTHQG